LYQYLHGVADVLQPDPLLSANLYCSRRLDEVIRQAIVPFWSTVGETAGGECSIWLVRYPRRGEHLKVRLHGPETWRGPLQEGLTAAAERLFAALDPPPPGEARVSNPTAPPIDDEDRPAEDHPDRTLLWTRYRRSHVSLAGKPFLDDDRYVALIAASLARACDVVLASFRSAAAPTEPSHQRRQTLLLETVIAGLGALDFEPAQRHAYLAFHRDWLLRFNLVRSKVDDAKTRQFLADFDRRARAMSAVRERLRAMASDAWRQGPADLAGARCTNPAAAWGEALAALRDHVTPLAADPDFHVDPFASDPLFPPLFKAFHGLANQLGVAMLDEALSYHLLLCALASSTVEADLAVALTP
jgi:Lantibiotic biosynthesis dehydratase C-term